MEPSPSLILCLDSPPKKFLVAKRTFGIRYVYGRRRSLIKSWQLNFPLSSVALFERVVHRPQSVFCGRPCRLHALHQIFALMKTLMFCIFDIFPLNKSTQKSSLKYRDWLKGMQILLSRTQAGPSKTVKQEREEISFNHIQAL